MNFSDLSDQSKAAVSGALALRERMNHAFLAPVHVIQEILDKRDPQNGAYKILDESTNFERFQKNVAASLISLPHQSPGEGDDGMVGTLRSFERGLAEARKLSKTGGNTYVGIDHLVIGLFIADDMLAESLIMSGGSLKKLLEAGKNLRDGKVITAAAGVAQSPDELLHRHSTDMTALARDGQLPQVIGRDDETRRAIQILCRCTKNNPVLIGEPGVGKTSIVEGLAARIASGDVPEELKGKTLRSLDVGSLVAGTRLRGEFEERMKAIMRSVLNSNGQIILFIDELHLLVGAGKGEGSSMDAANLLKPELARGALKCIGATTLSEYRKHIEKDPALSRRFQSVIVDPPSVEEAIAILRGGKERFEKHHGVIISDSAIVAAAQLSDRYITDRFLPDKAIDLIDEAASALKMQIVTKPAGLDKLERRMTLMKIEREALSRESDIPSSDRLAVLERALVEIEIERAEVAASWEKKKAAVERLKTAKLRLEDARKRAKEASQADDLFSAAGTLFQDIPKLEKEVEMASSEEVAFFDTVTQAQIAEVVKNWTGIPVDTMLANERQRLLSMEDFLRKRVVGQEEALQAVSDAVRRARVGVQDPDQPLGSFLFLGPTGVGKTELSKALAGFLFDDERAMLRLDMSEFMEKQSVARLVGSPPGYVGYDEGGILTEAVRRRPYQVILFDEVEKAHEEVFNILLQVLDDGRLTDSQGITVDFRNTLIILTSNLGGQALSRQKDGQSPNEAYEEVMEAVRSYFRPEFINRIDETVLFGRLQREDMTSIVSIQLERLRERMAAQQVGLHVASSARAWLANAGYDPQYGARPLKRVIQKEVQNKMASYLLKQEEMIGSKIFIDEKDGGLVLRPFEQ